MFLKFIVCNYLPKNERLTLNILFVQDIEINDNKFNHYYQK